MPSSRAEEQNSQSQRYSRKSRDQHRTVEDDILAIILDERSGREYYVSMLDYFPYKGRSYSVMYNFEPDDGSRPDPEIIIMRSWRDDNGEQVFSSIRDRKELDAVFEIFFNRYLESTSADEDY